MSTGTAMPTLGVPAQNLSVTTDGRAAVTPTMTNTVTLMSGEGARLTPTGSYGRSTEELSILNIPLYSSHNVQDDENPSLHRPEVVEPPNVFQRPSGQGAHPKTFSQYSTRTMAEELGYATGGRF